MPWLKMLRGPKPGDIYELVEDRVTIGRGRKNTIIIHDNEVSREHCIFIRVLDAYELHDLNSTNGTFVNGQQVDGSGWLVDSRCIIEIGDSITLEYSPTAPPLSETQEMASAGVEPLQDDDDNPREPSYLIIKTISQPEPEIYPLDIMTVNIGRDLNNDIVVPEPEISRNHIRLTLVNNQYAIEDLGTLNGTYVNDIRLEDTLLLRFGDVIKVGTSVEMTYTNRPTDDGSTLPGDFLPSVIEEPPTNRIPSVGIQPNDAHAASGSLPLGAGDLVDHVFIAYADSEWVNIAGPLHMYLEESDISIWAPQGLQPDTDDWRMAINQALAECACLLVILSPAAMETPYVRRAARYFFVREKPVVVLKYEETDNLPMALRNTPAIQYDESNMEAVFRTVLAAIRKISV